MRGGVLAGGQERERVPDDFLVGERAFGLLRGEHALEKVLGRLPQLGSLEHPLAGLRDEPLHRRVDRHDRAPRRAVGGELYPTPVGKRRHDATTGRLEQRLDVALQLVVATLSVFRS